MIPLRLGVLATHPIQYHAPLYRELAATEDVDLTVFFCHRPTPKEQGVGFGVEFEWDVDLTSGYRHVWLENVSPNPSVAAFRGCDTPGIVDWIQGRQGAPFHTFIVHGWAWKSCWQAFRACWRARTPLVVRGDSQLPSGRQGWRARLKQAAKRVLYPLMMKRFDLCLAYGKRSAEYFSHYGARRTAIAPHFVDNDFFAERARECHAGRAEQRRRWGIPEDAFCLLLCGKLAPVKRPLDVLAALRRLPDGARGSRPLHLLIVGDGELRQECEDYARRQALPVSFAGFLNQSELSAAYAACDALVLCSQSETWGLVVNEAMACGLPVVVSSTCGCAPDLVEDGVTGLVFPQGDVAALARCIRWIWRCPADFDADVIRDRVGTHSVEVVAQAMLANIRQMLEDRAHQRHRVAG